MNVMSGHRQTRTSCDWAGVRSVMVMGKGTDSPIVLTELCIISYIPL